MAKQKETPQIITLTNTKDKTKTKELDLKHAAAFLKQMAAMKLGSLYALPEGWSFDGNDIVKA